MVEAEPEPEKERVDSFDALHQENRSSNEQAPDPS